MDKSYQKLTITLPENLLNEFRRFCENNGINLSSRIAILIKEDLEKKNPLKWNHKTTCEGLRELKCANTLIPNPKRETSIKNFLVLIVIRNL